MYQKYYLLTRHYAFALAGSHSHRTIRYFTLLYDRVLYRRMQKRIKLSALLYLHIKVPTVAALNAEFHYTIISHLILIILWLNRSKHFLLSQNILFIKFGHESPTHWVYCIHFFILQIELILIFNDIWKAIKTNNKVKLDSN